MIKTRNTKTGHTCTFSSSAHLVDRVIESCHAYLGKAGFERFGEFDVVARELILNAIEHGNAGDPVKNVTLEVGRAKEGRVRLKVQDQGKGFDTAKLVGSQNGSPGRNRQRGYPMIRALSDTLEFEKKGAVVTALITIPEPRGFRVVEKDSLRIVEPVGDLKESVAESFRLLLVDLLDQGHTDFCFDLRNVRAVDSICLSVLVSFAKMVEQRDSKKKIRMDHMSDYIRSLFQFTRLDQVFALAQAGGN